MARKSRKAPAVTTGAYREAQLSACVYTRLSVEDGDDAENNSLGNQLKLCLSFIDGLPGVAFTARYSDNGYTGMNYERPGFRSLMRDIEEGRVNCVVVKDISRLGRNFILTSELVERTLPGLGVRLICVNDGYDSASENADTSALTMPLKMVMNEHYVHDISQKIRSGISAKMKSGNYLPSSGSVPYGYLRATDGSTYDIDPETAPVVKRIFELRLAGNGFNEIARRLNDEGIPSPGKLRYIRGMNRAEKYRDAIWIRGTVRKLLEDRTYTGCRIHGTMTRDKVCQKKLSQPEEKWLRIENAHTAIISDELFNGVQAVNAEKQLERAGFDRRNGCGESCAELFRGKVFCAECGAKMGSAKGCARQGAATPSRIFFDCNNYRYSSHKRCSSHYIRQERLMELVKNALDKQLELTVDLERLIESVRRSPAVAARRREAKERLERARSARRNMEVKLQRLLEDWSEGVIDADEYQRIKAKYDADYGEIVELEAKSSAAAIESDSVLRSAEKWVRRLRQYQALPELNRELLDQLVDRIEVTSGRDVRVKMRCADPFAPLSKYTEVMPDAV